MQPLFTEWEVSEQLKVTVACLRKWRLLGKGPRFVKVGNRVRYAQEDLASWLVAQPAGGTIPIERLQDAKVKRMALSA